MDRVLVIGGSGLLGQYLLAAMKEEFETFATYKDHPFTSNKVMTLRLDITSGTQVERTVKRIEPQCIILLSALTRVDDCEKNPERARLINAQGPRNVAKAARSINSKMVYVSTDYVFNGKKGNYLEEDEPDPISVYGKTKLEGELAVRKELEDFIIARVCVLYGWNRISGKDNFVTWALKGLESGKEVPLFIDQNITPTFAAEASKILIKLYKGDEKGIFHASGKECISRYEMGKKIAKVFGLDGSLLKPVRMEDIELVASRPKNSCLNVSKVEKELNIRIRGMEESLMEMRDTR